MKTASEKILPYLQKALQMEYSDIFLYPRHTTALAKYPWLVQLFNNFGQSEVRHADMLAMEIRRLGVEPQWDFYLLEGKKTISQIIDWHLAHERKAIDIYERCLKLVRDNKLNNTIQNILTEETIHEASLIKIQRWL